MWKLQSVPETLKIWNPVNELLLQSNYRVASTGQLNITRTGPPARTRPSFIVPHRGSLALDVATHQNLGQGINFLSSTCKDLVIHFWGVWAKVKRPCSTPVAIRHMYYTSRTKWTFSDKLFHLGSFHYKPWRAQNASRRRRDALFDNQQHRIEST